MARRLLNGTLAQAVLHVMFSWLATFNGCSLGVDKNTCSMEKKSPRKSNVAELHLVVSRDTFQRALKSRSLSLEKTLGMSAPHLRSSGGSSCRTDRLAHCFLCCQHNSCSESTASLGILVYCGLTLLTGSIWWECDAKPLSTATT